MNNEGYEILIVEDHPTLTEQLKHTLERHGYNVAAAYNGKEALSYLSEHKPQMVISDIVMPEMNGYELCKEIKSGESTMDIPVILLTSLSRPEDVLESISCGANYFITKPYREDYLISHIEQILVNRKINKNERVRVGVEIVFGGKRHFITACQQQMLTLLISTYEAAVQRNNELVQTHDELEKLNEHLEELVKERTAELSAEIAFHKRTEERVIKLNRIYAVLRNINQAIVRIHETRQLLKDACLIAIDEGKFQSAWIGIVNYKTKKIEISATAGLAHNLMEVSPNQNPIVSVIRSGKYFVSNNINTDNSLTGIWKQNALSLEFRSFAVFPLIVFGKVIGGFCIYSNEVDFFDKLEISLLDEMAADISFALEYIQKETKRKRVEELLRESEERFTAFMNNSPAVAWMKDPATWTFSYINNAFEKVFDITREVISKKTDFDLWPEEVARQLRENDLRVVSSDKTIQTYEDVPLPDGTVRHWLVFKFPLHTPSGKRFLAGTAVDITERKRAEEALRESEERYRSLVDSTEDSIYLIDRGLNYLYANAKTLSRLRCPLDKLVGKGYINFHSTQATNKFSERVEQVFVSGKSLTYEYRSERDHRYFLRTLSPVIKPETKEIFAITIISKDITERKQAEEEIISQKNRFAQLFDNSPIAIALLDDQDRVAFINESFSILFGYFLEEVRGKSLNDLIVPPELKEEAKSYSDQTRAGNQINKESYRRRKDGTLVCVQIIGVPVAVNDKTVGLYGMYVDLTQRKKAEEELTKAKEQSEEMNRLKNYFLSNMSHELRTPLISVLGFAELLQQELKNPEHLEFVNNIIEGGQRLNNTLSGILEISKLETANSFLNLQQYNLADEIKARVKSFLPMAQSKRLFLKTELNDTYLNAYIDTELFGKALFHLVSNGIKFTKEGGVFVSLNHERKQDHDWAVTKVIDTGVGIPKENFDNIFSAFSQLDEGYSKSHEGTGLGLTIAKRIVELMKGYMQVESDVGKGSVFSVWLPAIPNQNQIQQQIKEKRSTTIIKPPTIKEKRLQKILVVDDNSSNRLFMNHCLSSDVRIIEAEDGISAVTLASKEHFDLILMDINLGAGIDGVQAMHEIRKIPGYTCVPIIAVTAYVMFGDKERFLSEGFDFYLAKPFMKDALVSFVEKTLAKVKK